MVGVILPNRGRGAAPPSTGPFTLVSTPEKAFDMPEPAAFAAASKMVAIHLQTNYRRKVVTDAVLSDPTSYEKRNWLPPGAPTGGGGESGRDVYGGLWRNAPLSRPVIGDTTTYTYATGVTGKGWELQDKRWELQQMKAIGVNHVVACFLSQGDWYHTHQYGHAAFLEGMTGCVVLQPDCEVSIVHNGATNLVNHLLECVGPSNPYRSAYAKHTDGRWLIVPYEPEVSVVGGTSNQQRDYWVSVCQQMDAAGQPIALFPCFSKQWTTASNFTIPTFNDAALAPWVVGFTRWGTADPVQVNAADSRNTGNIAHSYGKKAWWWWRTEDVRPNQGKFSEAGGWELLTAGGDLINSAPNIDGVGYVSWSDWAEAVATAPSELWGWSALDVMAYYICKFRLGYTPPIIRDTTYLAHRIHRGPVAGSPTYTHPNPPYTTKMVRTGSTVERNEIDMLCFTTAPATARITVNGTNYDTAVPAGVTRVQAPLAAAPAGGITCKLIRSGSDVAGTFIQSPFAVNFTTQLVQDLVYRRLSSRRPQTRPFTP